MISKGRVVCSRFFFQLIGFLSVSCQNTKIRQAKKGKSFEAFGRTWHQIVIARSYNHVRILMKFIFFVDLTNAAKGPKRTTTRSGHPVEKEPPVNTPKRALSDEWKDELRRREEEMVQAVEEAER